MSTPFQKEFLDSLANIWASHWPEDTTYGRKDKDHRTLLSKRVVWPPGVSSGEFDIEDFEIRHAVSHEEAHIRKCDAVGTFTLECIYSVRSHHSFDGCSLIILTIGEYLHIQTNEKVSQSQREMRCLVRDEMGTLSTFE